MEAVILAAGLGKRLRPILIDRPKCLLEIDGKTLLERQIDQLRRNNVGHIWVVVGHMAREIMARVPPVEGVSYVYNPEYATSNNVVSLHKALGHIYGEFIYVMGDCIYEDGLLSLLAGRKGGVVVAVDFNCRVGADDCMISTHGGRVIRIGKCIDDYPVCGRFVGAVKVGNEASGVLRNEIDKLLIENEKDLFTSDVLDLMIRQGLIEASFVDVTDLYWDEIDIPEDWERVKKVFPSEGSIRHIWAPG